MIRTYGRADTKCSRFRKDIFSLVKRDDLSIVPNYLALLTAEDEFTRRDIMLSCIGYS